MRHYTSVSRKFELPTPWFVTLMQYAVGFFDHEILPEKTAPKTPRGGSGTMPPVKIVSRIDLDLLARPERFELPTPWFVARYSIQLSYGRAVRKSCPK